MVQIAAIVERIRAEYKRKHGFDAFLAGANGIPLERMASRASDLAAEPCLTRLRAFGLQEAVHWGESYIFDLAPSVVSWLTPLVEGREVRGGLIGGAAIPAERAGQAEAAVSHLAGLGLTPSRARSLLRRLKVLPAQRIKDAALWLERAFYSASGWKPELLQENRIKREQQRQIRAAIEAHGANRPAAYPLEKERMLLALIRAGDRNGARRLLNEMLGVMFLFSPQLAVLRARAVELMGYLTRAAIEDNPLLEPLLAISQEWTGRLVRSRDFESLAHALMRALDEFMEGICLRGFDCRDQRVSRILDFVRQNFARPISMSEAARRAALSPSRAGHLLKERTGRTLLQHVMRLRVEKARQLLARTSKDCAQIAVEVGFCDQSHFTRHFRRLTGTTPARYRRSASGGRASARAATREDDHDYGLDGRREDGGIGAGGGALDGEPG